MARIKLKIYELSVDRSILVAKRIEGCYCGLLIIREIRLFELFVIKF